MALFVVCHQHPDDKCPAKDPQMGQMLLQHLSGRNAAEAGISINGEAIVNDEHTMYLILDAASRTTFLARTLSPPTTPARRRPSRPSARRPRGRIAQAGVSEFGGGLFGVQLPRCRLDADIQVRIRQIALNQPRQAGKQAQLVGRHHQPSTKHWQAYLDEMAFRFNNRGNPSRRWQDVEIQHRMQLDAIGSYSILPMQPVEEANTGDLGFAGHRVQPRPAGLRIDGLGWDSAAHGHALH